MRHFASLLLLLLCALPPASAQTAAYRRLPLTVYRDRMMGGWLGQMCGVAWGAPTEFRWCGKLIPETDMPSWHEDWVNSAFGQDDLYVEMTFLRTLEQYGLGVPIRQAGIDFANSQYGVWCANRAGRENLRRGIAPPDSSHPRFNRNADDIDYQIEADFSGLIAPGLPNTAIALGEKFGRLMNYGDGLYAGQFIGGMYAEGFFHRDRVQVVEAGLRCIPAGSQYAEMVRDVLRWYREDPRDWVNAWELVNAKYLRDPAYRRFSSSGTSESSVDARLNGAYVLIGLLYGNGDPDRTITIACRCGEDSDCNPANAGGVLFAAMGYERVPERFRARLDRQTKWAYTAYDWDSLLAVCEKLARQAVTRAGGIVVDERGQEVFLIPVQTPRPGPLQQSWAPGPITNSRFTPAEMSQITEPDEVTRGLRAAAPGWELRDCGPDMDSPCFLDEYRGRKAIFQTHPLNRATGSRLVRQVAVPAAQHTRLEITCGHHTAGDWLLIVRVDGQSVCEKPVGPETATDGWLQVAVDLTPWAGKTVNLELVNQPTGWMCEAAYWARVEVASE
jgi:hypothetical protein